MQIALGLQEPEASLWNTS